MLEYGVLEQIKLGQDIEFPGPAIAAVRYKSGMEAIVKYPDDFNDGWPHPKDRVKTDYVTHILCEKIE